MKTSKILLIYLCILSFILSFSKVGLCQNEKAMFSNAESLFVDSRYQEAITSYQEFIELFPYHNLVANAYYNIGESYYRLMDFALAEKYFKEVMTNFPKDTIAIEAQNRLGDSYQKQELLDQAMAEYQKVIELHPHTLYADYAQYAINWLKAVIEPKEMVEAQKETQKIQETPEKPKSIKKAEKTKIKPKKKFKVSLVKKEKKAKEEKDIPKKKIVINLINNISNQGYVHYLNQLLNNHKNLIIMTSSPFTKTNDEAYIYSISETPAYFFELQNKKIKNFPPENKNQVFLKPDFTLTASDATSDHQVITLKVVNNSNNKVIADKEVKGSEEEIKNKLNIFIKDLERLFLKR
ncbi:MAG: tetratricopeptide repeat protein [bacterium]